MAPAADNKVVPLGEHPRAKARFSPQESSRLLDGCRELALDRMAKALSGMLDRVEDELFELAEHAGDRAIQNLYLDARHQAREKRHAIESAFRGHFVECFNRKVRGESAARREAGAGELSLVEPEDLEESIAVSEMSRKMKAACEGELFALGQRMGFLLERPNLEDDANPVSPATVCAALKDACDQIESDFRVRMTLLRQLERHTEAELQRVYAELNAHLVERRVLPEVRPIAARRAAAAPAPVRREAAPAEKPRTEQADLFNTLAQLLGASLTGNAPAPGATPAAWPTAAGTAPPPAPELVAELTRMHREAPVEGAGGDMLVNVIRNLRAAAASGGTLGTVDAMTIDIVAMLFDYIFEDRHIPASVKALLGRLQIPTLKVALLDKSFFSSKSHPARRLLDLLAEISIGVDEANAGGGATLALIGDVVTRVLEEFDTDLGLFESLVARVESFLEERRRAEADVVERSARLIEAREREEIAHVLSADEVARRLQARAWVPPAVREMLEETWARAIARAQATEGEGSELWQKLLLTMEELLWSVEPKCTPDDRKRLITMLPGMLRHLQEGFECAGVPDDRCSEFLGALVDCHALAVKAGLRGMAAIPEPPVRAPVPEEPKIERALVPAGDLRVEEIRLRAPRGAARNVFTRTGVWTNVQRGTWVEFVHSSQGAMRARLTWISPNKGVYLFTNPLSGATAVSISPEALAEQLRTREARILDDAPLMDRAVDSMLETLRRDPRAQG